MGPPKGAGVQGPGSYTTVEELKDSIRREIRKLDRNKDMFMAVFDNFLVHGACVKLLNCTIIELHI